MDEPVTFVVERRHGDHESASIIVGPLPSWLTDKRENRLVYALRLDKLPHGAQIAAKPIFELYAEYAMRRDAGKLPPSNLADPPRQQYEEKGVRRGPETWWTPTPLPRGDDWTED